MVVTAITFAVDRIEGDILSWKSQLHRLRR